MLKTINNFKIEKNLWTGLNLKTYRVSDENNKLFILKKVNNLNHLNTNVIELNSEYEIISALSESEISLKPVKIEKAQDGYYSLFEDFDGILLEDFIKTNKSNLDVFYEVAIRLCNVLKIIHDYGYIHKNINPSIILINPKNYELKIIDFAYSIKSIKEESSWKNFSKKENNSFVGLENNNYWQELKLSLDFKIDGDVKYISPEQTGRVNRSIDYRADFYSLGVLFYSFFSELPFDDMDILNIIHFHLADNFDFDNSFPLIIKEIIKKMTSKMAEDRYQTMPGLMHDLEQWFSFHKTEKQENNFKIGQKDISKIFTIQQKLYGRENEINQITEDFEKFINDGKTSITLVSGYSGIGKTSLVKETSKIINENKLYFIKSKYDQYNKNIPFSAIIEIFKNLLKMILTESDEELKNYEKKLIKALDKNAKIITNIIPELEFIIGGPQEDLIELNQQESINRFYKTFKEFVKVFATKEHPLVIFLDDLQWVDNPSLSLISNLIEDKTLNYLYIILAYRDNEVDSTHPFYFFINKCIENKIKIQEITLKPLKIENIKKLLEDSLYSDSVEISEIAMATLLNTNGNPFFINNFLKNLNEEKMIYFDENEISWKWKIDEIKKIKISNNIVDLLIGKIIKFKQETREMLKLASCIGNIFDLTMLAEISKKNISETAIILNDAISIDMISPIGNAYKLAFAIKENKKMAKVIKYKFQHDKIQEAFYTLLNENQKSKSRINIGRILYENKEENIFDITNHFNAGLDSIETEEELFLLLKLNLESAKKAKKSTAYKQSLDYLNNILSIINNKFDESFFWDKKYDFILSFYIELAEVNHLNGNFSESKEIIYKIIEKTNDILLQCELYNLLISQFCSLGEYQNAFEIINKALGYLDEFLPNEKINENFEKEINLLKINLKNREILDLLNEKDMQNEYKKITIKILTNSLPMAYNLKPELFPIISAKMVNIFLKYGPSADSYGISCYSIVLATGFKDYKNAYEYSLLAVKISEKYKNQSEKTKAANVLANYTTPFIKHIKNSEKINIEGLNACYDSGEFLHGSYCAMNMCLNAFYQGINLKKVEEEKIADLYSFALKIKSSLSTDTIFGVKLIVNNLTNKNDNKLFFEADGISETEYISNCEKHQSMFPICLFRIMKSKVLFIYEENELAYEEILKAKKDLAFISGQSSAVEFNFYHSLILISMIDKLNKEEVLTQINENQKDMKIWADNCSENFLHKYLLVEAELANLKNENWQAMELYNASIAEAKKNGFTQNLAIAYDLAGKFFYKKNNHKLAQRYFFSAYENFEKWGAIHKIESLRKKYPNFILSKNINSLENNNLFFENTNSLDFKSILKSSSVIAGEIRFDTLLQKLMHILIENTGAERGIFILKREDILSIEMESFIDKEKNNLFKNQIDIDRYEKLPKTLINYVERTKDYCVIGDAMEDDRFNKDEYIKNNEIKSVLCSPIIKQGDLIGIVYLENNLAENNFTEERIELIKILSAQAAISIDNAILYANLEQKVMERTEELAEKNKAITDSINYAKHIQYSILPSETILKNKFNDSAVLFKPKDIVSGDFYWYFEIDKEIFIAIGDCTGHGVPGAFLSMIGTMLLNQIVKEMKIKDPSVILKSLNEHFEKLLKQNKETNTNDSMELCLCRISENEIAYAGSRPLYYTKNDELITIKGQTIQAKLKGEYVNQNINIENKNRYVFYLTSDGIQDQHDEERKKIMSKGFLNIIEKYHTLSAQEQKIKIEEEILKHQGKEKQTDDITLICIVIER